MGCSETRENIESKMLTLKIRKAQIQKERFLRCKELSKFTGRVERRPPVKDFLINKNKDPVHNQRLFFDDETSRQHRSLSPRESRAKIIQKSSRELANLKPKRNKSHNTYEKSKHAIASLYPNQAAAPKTYTNQNNYNGETNQQNQYNKTIAHNNNNHTNIIPNNPNRIMSRESRQRRCYEQQPNSCSTMLNYQSGHCNCCHMNKSHNCCYIVSLCNNGNCNCSCNCNCNYVCDCNCNNNSVCQPINHQSCDCFAKPHSNNFPAPNGPDIVQGRVLVQPNQSPSSVNYYN